MDASVQAISALNRLLSLARADTEESETVASFLLAWADSPEHDGFSFRGLRSLSTPVRADVQAVMNMLFACRFPSPESLGVGQHIRNIQSFPGQEIAWRLLERKACKKGPLTQIQQGHVQLLTSIYLGHGHSEEAIALRLATKTAEEVYFALHWHIGVGHMSAEECDEHIDYLLKAEY
jgi:hypothetical protein